MLRRSNSNISRLQNAITSCVHLARGCNLIRLDYANVHVYMAEIRTTELQLRKYWRNDVYESFVMPACLGSKLKTLQLIMWLNFIPLQRYPRRNFLVSFLIRKYSTKHFIASLNGDIKQYSLSGHTRTYSTFVST